LDDTGVDGVFVGASTGAGVSVNDEGCELVREVVVIGASDSSDSFSVLRIELKI
jgi:hypothetical protein